MADANLLAALSKYNNKLDNVVIFGRIRCVIQKPKILGNGLEIPKGSGYFAIVDAYALKCVDVDYFGDSDIRDANKLYFTRGSMIIFIDSVKWVGKDVKVYKRGSSGPTIKRQWGAKTPYDGISAFVFAKVSDGFRIVPNKLVELGRNDSDVRGTALQDFIVSVVVNKEGVIEYPVTLDSIQGYEGLSEYEVIENVDDSEKFDSCSERIDVSKIDLHLTYHLDGANRSEFSDIIEEQVEEMSEARREYCSELLGEIDDWYRGESKDDFDYSELGHMDSTIPIMGMSDVQLDLKRRFVVNIASRDNEYVGNSKLRGNYYVGEFLKFATEGFFCGLEGEEATRDAKSALRESVELLAGMVSVDASLLMGDSGSGFEDIPLLRNNLNFATVVMALILGRDPEDFALSMEWMNSRYSITYDFWFYLLIRCPYVLGLLSPGFSLVECDAVYLAFTRFYSDDCLVDFNMDMRANLMFLANVDNASDKDSLVSVNTIKNVKTSYSKLGTRYCIENGIPVHLNYAEAVRVLMGVKPSLPEKGLDWWVEMPWYSNKRMEELSDNGILEIIDDKVMLVRDMEKEYMIYDTLISKGHTETGVTSELIAKTVKKFEKDKGFTLEKLQRDAMQLTRFRAGVLSGCAGSGKTTTSDCMVEIFRGLKNFERDFELVFCAPTGKACRRLAEVVGGTVRTIHSQFGVFMGGGSYMESVSRRRPREGKIRIYLLDEMAMCSMPLLYEICRNLEERDFIYFLGDCKQLPPIGKGNPFALLMRILPCVELGVSKRAAEGSLVNYNTTLVNCMSDGVVRELLYNSTDFIKRECSDATIPLEVVKCWREFMTGSLGGVAYGEDDIQVITGYQKESISFSAPNLNPPIQRLLRGKDRLLFRHVGREFYENDRVIHLRRNDYSICRYFVEGDESTTFVPAVTFGMVNGEMGKLVGIVRSDMVHVQDFSEKTCTPNKGYYKSVSSDDLTQLIRRRESREDNLRDDSKVKNNRTYFVIVSVYDVDICKDVVVLYRASARIVNGETVLEGGDLANLDLAYALTTHKMQGSQSPVVILPFGSSCNPRFINRNMLNTMITRSQGVVCMVGDITGSESPVNRGRMYVSPVECSDLLTILSNS